MIEFKKNEKNKYQFVVKSETGHILFKSVPFENKISMKASLATVSMEATVNSKLFERKTNHEGKFLVELKNNNGQTIGSSGLYSSEAGMENGILNISNSISNGLKLG